MIEPDEELRKVLRQWEPPAVSAKLDERVWAAFREATASRRGLGTRKWLPITAGVLLMAGAARFWLPGPQAPAPQRSVSIETTTDAEGFRPLPNGTITVVKARGKQ